jgi:hypothetical protein
MENIEDFKNSINDFLKNSDENAGLSYLFNITSITINKKNGLAKVKASSPFSNCIIFDKENVEKYIQEMRDTVDALEIAKEIVSNYNKEKSVD